MRCLVSNVGDLQQHVRGQTALDREVPLLVIRGLERGRIGGVQALSDQREQALGTAWRKQEAARERVAQQRGRVNAVPTHGGHRVCGGLKRVAVEFAGGAIVWNTEEYAVACPNDRLVVQ